MLPITIVFLIWIGMDKKYIPWYQETPTNQIEVSYQKALSDLLDITHDNKISIQDLNQFIRRYEHFTIIAYDKDYNNALKGDLRHQEKHFFIWLPYNQNRGKVQIYGTKGLPLGDPIEILRGP